MLEPVGKRKRRTFAEALISEWQDLISAIQKPCLTFEVPDALSGRYLHNYCFAGT
jgi:hypothetical protein